MKYSVGNYVRKVNSPNDVYVVTHTREDEEIHDMLRNGSDYLIKKDWDDATKSVVKHAPFEPVFEEDIQRH